MNCLNCGKREALAGMTLCLECASAGEPQPPFPQFVVLPSCAVCREVKGSNLSCRACRLVIEIAILRVRALRQWEQFKGALKEMFHGC